jgi:hypothetical protein
MSFKRPSPTDRITGMSTTGNVAFVPPEFEVPMGLTRNGLELVPLGPEHNESDYRAWPHPMSLDENLNDLRQHAEDFKRRVGFTYTVKIGSDIIGCVYIYPSEQRGWARVRSWVRHDHAGLDRVLYTTVREWLENEWTFEGIEYSPRETR